MKRMDAPRRGALPDDASLSPDQRLSGRGRPCATVSPLLCRET